VLCLFCSLLNIDVCVAVRPIWREHYIDYKALKQCLKSLKHDTTSTDEEARVDSFLLALDTELAKVNVFFATYVNYLEHAVESTIRSLHGGVKSDDERQTALHVLRSLNAELVHLRAFTELNCMSLVSICYYYFFQSFCVEHSGFFF
jgi:SPX domain protein involved in polyphosphate accumulation